MLVDKVCELQREICEHERFLIPLADSLAERLYAERNAMFIQRHYNPAFPVASILEDMAG